jgi:hypothetical protein
LETSEAPIATDTPASSTSVESAPVSNDSVYDTAVTEMLSSEPATPVVESAAPAEVIGETPATPAATSGPMLTDGVKQILSRAGLKEDFIQGWDQARVDNFATYLSKSQAEQDRLGAELGRLKAPPEQTKTPAKQPETPKEPVRDEAYRTAVIEAFGDEVIPMLDRQERIETENHALRQQVTQFSEQASMLPMMANLVTEMLLDAGLSSLERDYPSVGKPEARKQVEDRFWLEWNTGAYAKEGVGFREQMRAALQNAAKVTFINVTEQTAAANLVNTNKSRVASQPKLGASQQQKRPTTADDIYDQAYTETMASR